MFLIPERIYLNMIKNIEDPNQQKRVEDLNAETNYLEKALRFHQLKSFKSHPNEGKKQSSPVREINDSYSLVDDNTDEMQTEYLPQEMLDEQMETIVRTPPPILTRQKTSSITAPPVIEPNIISPVVDVPQFQQQGAREAASSQTEKDRAKFRINWAINDIVNSSSLKCPFCQKSTNFTKAGFFARHVNLKHGYFLNTTEQRMVKENLEKIKQQQTGQKKKVLLNPSFLQSHRQDMMELNQARERSVFDEKLDKMGSRVKLGKSSQPDTTKQIGKEEQLKQAKKRPVFDEKLGNAESTVKLGKLSQQEIDKQITEGKKRPN